MTENKFKPFLIPNSKGEEIDWHEKLGNADNWLVLTKRDGVRLEIDKNFVKGRSLKLIKNKQILEKLQYLQSLLDEGEILEGEFYSHEMTFPEIMHFFKTEDVESAKTKIKYEKLWAKTGGDPSKGWTYPGRSVEWLTTWNDSLSVFLFDVVSKNSALSRLEYVDTYSSEPFCNFGGYKIFDDVDDILKFYQEQLDLGYEGLVLMHKDGKYKMNRATLNEGLIYKIKEDKLEFDGKVIDFVQATIVDPTVATTTNELGRTVTSKKKGDRLLIEAISGFLVEMDDGKQTKISLRGWDDDMKRLAWQGGINYYKDRWLVFTGMKPVKEGGSPRHPQFKYFRDTK